MTQGFITADENGAFRADPKLQFGGLEFDNATSRLIFGRASDRK
jgi:hypothetical protein